MTREEIISESAQGRNCAQCVLGAFADETGYDIEETDRVAKCFGGGVCMGQTCGAVTGAVMAIGFVGGENENAMEFEKRFTERFGSCVCKELLDGQMPTQAKESGKMLEVCPDYIQGAEEIAREIIEELI